MPTPNLTQEKTCRGIVAGVDEAGRGPLAGPVVAGAVVLNAKAIPRGIDDSKKLHHAKRELLFTEILACAQTGIGMASVEEIDELNILNATKLAMQRAIAALPVQPAIALVDGNQPPILPCEVRCLVKGDTTSLSIAAASIVAKVTRDRLMREIAREYPAYGFEKHMGYGTANHLEALRLHGATPHHRKSFAPVRKVML